MNCIRLVTSLSLIALFLVSCSVKQKPNTLTEKEKTEGWQLLFDGHSTEHWRGIYLDHFPEKAWKVENGMLIIQETDSREDRGGAIITRDQYSSFELSLEFKYSENANSGIKYFVLERPDTTLKHGLGLEYQIWNDEQERIANQKLAALYDLIPAEGKEVNPVGEWNHTRIIVDGSHVEHWLNGNKVVEFNRHSDEFRERVAGSKYNGIEDFGEYPQGHILLQDEGLYNAFRNIKIRELK